jgi:hypothetical protein
MLHPQPNQINPKLFWPALGLSLACALAGQFLLALRPEAFTLPWFRNPPVLLALHLTTVGFLSLLFLTVLLQAIPVLYHAVQTETRVGRTGQALLIPGAGLLLFHFSRLPRHAWVGASAGLLLLSGTAVLAVSLMARAKEGWNRTFVSKALGPSIFYFFCLLLLGAWMALGLADGTHGPEPLPAIFLHLHLGLYGFASLAIFGMAPKLLRLFQRSTGYAAWPLKAALTGTHAGLAILFLRWLGWLRLPLPAAGACFLFAALGFAGQLALLLKAAKARKWDSSLVGMLAATAFFLLAVGIENGLLAGDGGTPGQQMACFYLGLWGWVAGMMLAVLQKIIAVLNWYERFWEPASQGLEVPMAWPLIHPGLAWSVPALQALSTLSVSWGLATGQAGWIRTGGWLGALAVTSTAGLLALARVGGKVQLALILERSTS